MTSLHDLPGTALEELRELVTDHGAGCAVTDAAAEPIAESAMAPRLRAVPARALGVAVGAVGEWHDGDVLVTNDPYGGAATLRERIVAAPVVVAAMPVAFVARAAWIEDVGAMRPEVRSVGREIFHEGFRVGGLRTRVDDRRLLPERVRALLGANAVDERAFGELLDRQVGDVLQLADRVRDLVARAAAESGADPGELVGEARRAVASEGRSALGSFAPAGARGSATSGDVGVTATFGRGALELTLATAAALSRDPVNAPPAVTRAAALAAICELVDATAPAAAAAVDVSVPPKTILSAEYPFAVAECADTAFATYVAAFTAVAAAAGFERAPRLVRADFDAPKHNRG